MIAVSPLSCLMQAVLGVLMVVAQAGAQEARVAAAANADVIAVYSQQVERRLLRGHVDRAAAKISLVPFGPPGVETFAMAPNAAFIVYSTVRDEGAGTFVTYLSLLDEAGQELGEPLRSPVGAIASLAVSPKGDRVAVSSDRGWLALLAVEGTGKARRLAFRREIGVTADRQFTFAFRPDGGLVTIVDNWLATFRSSDGTVQRTLDLKTINPDLVPAYYDIGALFQLKWSPRDDRFAVSWGAGPMFTTLFDAGSGRRVKPAGSENDFNFGASKVEFADGGDAMIAYGMQAPVLVRLKSLAAAAFGDADVSVDWFVPLAGGHDVAALTNDQIALWSLEGKRLAAPVGLENYSLGTAAAGAKDDVFVAAQRGGWVDLYTKQGEFMRRVQSGVSDRRGVVAVSAGGATLAVVGAAELGVVAELRERAWGAALPSEGGSLVAVAGNGSRIVIDGPNKTLLSWAREGGGADSISLKAGEQVPERQLSGLAVSTTGDTIAVAEAGSAVWLASPSDKSVRRVALAAESVAPLPDSAGFAIGLSDGTVMRISQEGTAQGSPIKAAELGALERIVVAPDGQSFIAVEGDERQSRQLAWDGRLLAGPYRAMQSESISGAFFHEGSPRLIVSYSDSTPGASFGVVGLTPPGVRSVKPLDPPR
jgi:hypothetical protein